VSKKKRRTGRFWWFFVCLTRGLAAFFALYSLFSITASTFGDAYNQNAWWIDLSFLNSLLSIVLQVTLTAALGLYALNEPKHIPTRLIIATPLLGGLMAASINTVEVYGIASEGAITLGFPLPFSLFVSVVFLAIIMGVLFGHTYLKDESAVKPGKGATAFMMSLFFVVSGVLFPLGQMYCFGTTDYRVRVDAAVVLGAQVYPDGTPSPVLQDRLDTAIQFYNQGYTPVLVMSGGIDVEGTSEAAAMRDYAIAQGVAAANIIIDEYGSTTELTAHNTVEVLRAAGFTRVAAVSNFYHLARIKMLYLAEGLDVVTVPSVPHKDPRYPLFNVAREIPGWWYYWFQNLVK
jgi:vancomycin permeability regulator SanA